MSSLRFSFSPSSIRPLPSLPCSAKHSIVPSSALAGVSRGCSSSDGVYVSINGGEKRRRRSRAFRVRSSLDTAGPTATVGQVTEVNKDTFWPIVKSAGEKTVVLDMYTQWCGPCKVIAPRFKELSEKYLDVVFLKLDCNQDNRLFWLILAAIGEGAWYKGGSYLQDSEGQ
ncbi:thioredoxin F-type, chloroplastic-like isoform X2 [Tripterygium wilfordii]|uniref:thioredoxin F-type, chloroplastic-like isoform X2 n=1 Tax=Tripterygium wilfordii TaxID=458696 RepID=UPI0018F83894|nr:thioredoxin F-type, chloroplastic-like isoform X2 [Tripterygium wilfordii]